MSSTGSNSDGGVRNGNALPWATRMTISFLSFITDTSRRSNGTINRRFLHLCDFRSPPTPNPKSTAGSRSVSTSDVTVDSSRNLWFRLFVPASASAAPNSLPVLVFFHGGGFAFLSPDSFAYDAVCRRMARKIPAVVASVNYRLSPEHRYPCQYDDGFDVLNFLDGNHEVVLPRAADLSRCFLVGDSAGANLAHHVAVRAARKIRSSSSSSASSWKAVRIEGLISIQPYFGGEERTESEIRLPRGPVVTVERSDWLWKAFLPEGANRDHPVCNVSGPHAEDISGLQEFPNRTVVIVGGLDPLQDWQRRYYHWLRRSGKDARLLEYPAMIHAFYIFPELPDSTHLLTQLRGFIYPSPQSYPTVSV